MYVMYDMLCMYVMYVMCVLCIQVMYVMYVLSPDTLKTNDNLKCSWFSEPGGLKSK